jgi:hypothetical protein
VTKSLKLFWPKALSPAKATCLLAAEQSHVLMEINGCLSFSLGQSCMP